MEEFNGYCPICESGVVFSADGPWYRDTLVCPRCKSIVRERAVALKTKQIFPQWRSLSVHEFAPVSRGFTDQLKRECPRYVQSQWFPGKAAGTMNKGFRNEDVESQTFESESFDVVISLDVMEHLFKPDAAYREIFRTLKPGGAYIHTFPIIVRQVEAVKDRAIMESTGIVRHLEEAQFHGNPVDPNGSLVTKDYGYQIAKQIAEWAPFDVEITRFWDRTNGLIGHFTEIVVCRKPSTQ